MLYGSGMGAHQSNSFSPIKILIPKLRTPADMEHWSNTTTSSGQKVQRNFRETTRSTFLVTLANCGETWSLHNDIHKRLGVSSGFTHQHLFTEADGWKSRKLCNVDRSGRYPMTWSVSAPIICISNKSKLNIFEFITVDFKDKPFEHIVLGSQ